jgi:hypothetical protein
MTGTLEILILTSERFDALRHPLETILEIAPNAATTALQERQVTLDLLIGRGSGIC